jgi:putative membrane protein
MLEKGDTCTIPIQIKMGESTVTGIAFGNTVLVVLSMAPRGMEDVPNNIRIGIEQYSSELGFKHVLVIDSHNSMGAHLTNYDSCNLLSATRQCLEKLKSEKQYKFKIGYANSDEIQREGITIEDLGQSGLATLLLEIKQNRYLLGWADSNNMKNGIHNHIIFTLSNNGINMIEVCTSDTHATSGKRTRQGYYALGNISHPDKLSKMYLGVSKKSIDETFSANFELLLSVSKIKVMGKDQFNDYSSALDKSMNITKMFLVFIMVLFISMLITS